ncbi:MAG: transposase [Defluviitaleaceae bacterium]|nr:transposase [Defluviitaleaceae bacterium]
MYRKKSERLQITIDDFILPFGGKLSAENRWVKLAKLMPWDMIDEIYAAKFKNEKPDGNIPISSRVAFGSLHIRGDKNTSDALTLEMITESPYLQYFLGFKEFQTEPPFDVSMMTLFRRDFHGGGC